MNFQNPIIIFLFCFSLVCHIRSVDLDFEKRWKILSELPQKSVSLCHYMKLIVFETGAILFVKPMRKAEYITMLDPIQQRYGAKIGGLLFIPAFCGDLFWCGAVLRAMGSYVSVITGLDTYLSVCASALLAVM